MGLVVSGWAGALLLLAWLGSNQSRGSCGLKKSVLPLRDGRAHGYAAENLCDDRLVKPPGPVDLEAGRCSVSAGLWQSGDLFAAAWESDFEGFGHYGDLATRN